MVPAKRLQNLDLTFDGGSTGSGSAGSSLAGTAVTTPVPYPKSKSTSSLEESFLSASQAGSPSGSIIVADRPPSGTLLTSVANFRHHLSLNGSSSAGPCGGFSTQYAWMCDLHGLPYREEVAWVSLGQCRLSAFAVLLQL